jgi:hypothetical protein
VQMNVSYAPGSERSGQARPRRAMDEENDVSMFSSNRGKAPTAAPRNCLRRTFRSPA